MPEREWGLHAAQFKALIKRGILVNWAAAFSNQTPVNLHVTWLLSVDENVAPLVEEEDHRAEKHVPHNKTIVPPASSLQ